MTSAITKYFWYLIGVSIAFIAVLLIFQGRVLAQSPSPVAGSSPRPAIELTYPIEDLGGCADAAACMDYCQDPVNNTKCNEYAKQKGFYREDPVVSGDNTLWEKAKNDLGCDLRAACLDFCAQEGNFDKCDEFTKKNGLVGGYIHEPDKPEFIEIAKEVLGCDSLDSCSTVCSDPANSQKCTDFANKVGILGGEVQEGPSGCQTEGTCQSR